MDASIDRMVAARDGVRGAVRRASLGAAPGTRLLSFETTRPQSAPLDGALTGLDALAARSLTPAQLAQFRKVAARLPEADRSAMTALLASGALAGKTDRTDGKSVLDHLAQIAGGPLAPGIDRSALLSEAVNTLVDPTAVRQGAAETCGAATTQAMLAGREPAEYVRLLAGLASPAGRVQLANGQEIARQPGWTGSAIPGMAGKLLQPAFMGYAAGSYDAARDARADGRKGLFASEEAYLQEGVLGVARATAAVGGTQDLVRLAGGATRERPVTALITSEGRAHYVQITGIRGGVVQYADTRDGAAHSADLDAFAPKVQSVVTDAAPGTAARASRPTDEKGALGGCGNPLKAVGKAIGGAFDAVKSVGKKVVDGVKSVGKKVVDGVKSVGKKVVDGVKSVGKKIWNGVKSVAGKVWDGVKSIGKAIGKFWSKYGHYVMAALQVVTLVVPGLQPIALALAAYNGIKGGIGLYNGIKNGDWKLALGGALTAVGGVTGGLSALGTSALSAGAQAVANVAGKVSNYASKALAVAEGVRTRNWGAVIGGVAGAAAGVAGFVSDKAGAIADRFAGYAQRLGGVVSSVQNGDIAGAIGGGLGLAGAAGTREFGMSNDVAEKLGQVADLVERGAGLQAAIARRDGLGIAGAGLDALQGGLATATRFGLGNFEGIGRTLESGQRAVDAANDLVWQAKDAVAAFGRKSDVLVSKTLDATVDQVRALIDGKWNTGVLKQAAIDVAPVDLPRAKRAIGQGYQALIDLGRH